MERGDRRNGPGRRGVGTIENHRVLGVMIQIVCRLAFIAVQPYVIRPDGIPDEDDYVEWRSVVGRPFRTRSADADKHDQQDQWLQGAGALSQGEGEHGDAFRKLTVPANRISD